MIFEEAIRAMRRAVLAQSLLGLVLAAGVGSGCGLSSAPASRLSASTPIVVGSTLPLTGGQAAAGQALEQGEEAYLDAVNAHGGIDGHPIRLVIEDDQYIPSQTVADGRLLLDQDHVVAFLNAFGTSENLALEPLAARAGVPIVGAGSISDVVTSPPRPWLFETVPSEKTEVDAFVRFAVNRLHLRRIAILYQADAYGTPAVAMAQSALAALGLHLVAAQAFPPGASDLSTQILRLKDAHPDAVLLYALGQQTVLFFREARQLGWRLPQVFMGAANEDPALVRALGSAGEGTISDAFTDPPTMPSPAVKAMVRRFQRYVHAAPNSLSEDAYVGAEVLVAAIRQAMPNPSGPRIARALQSLRNFDPGVAGPISFGPDNHRGAQTVQLDRLEHGTFVPISGWIGRRSNR
ncbi:MAG: ABC transporter substrate-binding protein [Firmicutes bacterium]|nr:ABC transporter substrate-binding protein [Alicyclobacillaceae bacterium]MCL6496756.1 ABC transporter substrate-binding protein [Bacillota bacterium]